MSAPVPSRPALLAPAILVGAGVVAALSIGKLPPVLPVLQQEMGLSLVRASWMVSLFMVAVGLLGLVGGSLADRFGPRRVMVSGLLISAAAGAFGAFAATPGPLFLSRAIESVGFLLTVLPGPALLRQQVGMATLRGWLGIWAAYMPAGMALGLVLTPMLMGSIGWRGVWLVFAGVSLAWAALVLWTQQGALLAARQADAAAPPVTGPRLGALVWATLRAPGPWLLALCFVFYAGQFVGIFSFLPLVYREYGIAAQAGATLTALAVFVNVAGNLMAGVLLQRGVDRSLLLGIAAMVMAVMAWVAFGSGAPFAVRYVAILVLSVAGGLTPGTLFASVPFYAPSMATVSTTVGLMQQGSGVGQLLLPPIMAALAQSTGTWAWTWVASSAAALCCVGIAVLFHRLDRARAG